MKCKKIHKKLIPYFNKELSEKQNEAVKKHLENCKSCSELYFELKMTFNLVEKKEILKPNPFLYTRIKQQLIDIKNKKNKYIFNHVYKKITQTILLPFILVICIWAGIKIGSIKEIKQEQFLVYDANEFYFNDLEQEKIEILLLKE